MSVSLSLEFWIYYHQLVAQTVKTLPAIQETRVWYLGGEDPLKNGTHSSILAWRISWTEEPHGLQSRGFQILNTTEQLRFWGRDISGCPSGKGLACQYRRHKRCGFDSWVRRIPWSRKWQPTPVFLSVKFHGQRRLEGYSPWCHKELDI